MKKPHTPLFKIDIDAKFVDRLLFLAKVTGSGDARQVVESALKYFDQAVCAQLDGARIEAFHRNTTRELFNPLP